MPERVDARDVLDENASTSRPFRARVLGHFRRTGPNSWDDYVFVHDEEGPIDVLPGVHVHLERQGCDLRLRSRGRVLRVRWVPSEADEQSLDDAGPVERRRYFVERCLLDYSAGPGMGAAAVIARKLDE